MKIDTKNAVGGGVGRSRKAGSAKAGDFAKHLDGGDRTKSSAAAGVAPLRSVDVLLTLQEHSNTFERDREEYRRGHRLLSGLEAIRDALLLGTIPRGRLEALARELKARAGEALSPDLAALVGEIELRVRVELAKLSAN